MSDQQFDLIFRGDIVFGQSLVDVKARLAQLFKVDAAKVESLFTGRPVPLKRGLDLVSAQKYQDALLKAGAHVDISEVKKAENIVPVAPELRSEVTKSTQQIPTATKTDMGWSLAPVGADLLTAAEKPSFTPKTIDTSNLSLRPEGGFLLDPTEQVTTPESSVTSPNLDLALLGANLSEAVTKLPLVEIEVHDWDIADLGADLLSEDEKPIINIPTIAELKVNLADVGADLGQLKPNITPVTPDISGIQLVE